MRSQRTIPALVRPKGFGSTHMIGDESDIKHIGKLEFNKTPLEVLDAIISWAEQTAKKRAEFLNKQYRANCWKSITGQLKKRFLKDLTEATCNGWKNWDL